MGKSVILLVCSMVEAQTIYLTNDKENERRETKNEREKNETKNE